jgi:hypothetical protein
MQECRNAGMQEAKRMGAQEHNTRERKAPELAFWQRFDGFAAQNCGHDVKP